jgi:hypothetical protein
MGEPGLGTTNAPPPHDSGSTLDASENRDVWAVGSNDGATVSSSDGARPSDASTSAMDVDTDKEEPGAADAEGFDDGATAADASNGGAPEIGRLQGITAAHNAVRAMVATTPAIPPLTWSSILAAYAQQWATELASNPTTCAQPQHRPASELLANDYGENLAAYLGEASTVSTAQMAVDGWAAEEACWTYGTIQGTEVCNMTCTASLSSDGCGHYTQIVWRKTLELGCGVATCKNGQRTEDIWICNYSPAGNIDGKAPY